MNFNLLFDFLHNHYFLHMSWAYISLNSRKCQFFTDKIDILGHQRDEQGLQPSVNKLAMF